MARTIAIEVSFDPVDKEAPRRSDRRAAERCRPADHMSKVFEECQCCPPPFGARGLRNFGPWPGDDVWDSLPGRAVPMTRHATASGGMRHRRVAVA